jgi:hypothetical protein
LRAGIAPVGAADKGAGCAVGLGGHAAGVYNDYMRRAGMGGRFKSATT